MKNVAIITARDEQATIGELVIRLFDYCDEVLVVDDGSTDDTGDIAFISGARITRHETSEGIASSLMQLWGQALDLEADRIIQIDAGGSHDPAAIPSMLAKLSDIVIGSRFCPGAQYIGGKRKHASRIFANLCNFMIGGRVAYDWTSGYRVFTPYALEILLNGREYWTKAHAWQAEVLHRALRRSLSIAEAPIIYKAGRSSMTWKQVDDAILVLLKVMSV